MKESKQPSQTNETNRVVKHLVTANIGMMTLQFYAAAAMLNALSTALNTFRVTTYETDQMTRSFDNHMAQIQHAIEPTDMTAWQTRKKNKTITHYHS